jgi:ribosome biogenesis protein MAK21
MLSVNALLLDTIKQLWLTDLLPDDRRLKPLVKRHLSFLSSVAQLHGTEGRDRLLLLWYYETELHERCGQVVEALQILSQDVEENVRKKVAGVVYDLLASKPECEQELLSMLVNKLGDPTRQVSSKAAYLLLKLLSNHPNMKLVVVCEVETLLYRPNVSDKAQYYAICFLNQLIFSHQESRLASRLINIYLSFFKLYARKRSVETRMLGALLCGVNRAFPFAKIENDIVFQEHLDSLFQIVHVCTFNTSIQVTI